MVLGCLCTKRAGSTRPREGIDALIPNRAAGPYALCRGVTSIPDTDTSPLTHPALRPTLITGWGPTPSGRPSPFICRSEETLLEGTGHQRPTQWAILASPPPSHQSERFPAQLPSWTSYVHRNAVPTMPQQFVSESGQFRNNRNTFTYEKLFSAARVFRFSFGNHFRVSAPSYESSERLFRPRRLPRRGERHHARTDQATSPEGSKLGVEFLPVRNEALPPPPCCLPLS